MRRKVEAVTSEKRSNRLRRAVRKSGDEWKRMSGNDEEVVEEKEKTMDEKTCS